MNRVAFFLCTVAIFSFYFLTPIVQADEIEDTLKRNNSNQIRDQFIEFLNVVRFATTPRVPVADELADAVKAGNRSRVKACLKRKVDLEVMDENNVTPVYWAFELHNSKIAELLLKHGANVNGTVYQSPLLHLIIRTLNPIRSEIKLLLKYHADINATDAMGDTPLHVAVSGGKEKIVKLLLKHGANRNVQNKEGLTPLTLAEKYRCRHIMELLQK
jgi:ankyrin repeat protein